METAENEMRAMREADYEESQWKTKHKNIHDDPIFYEFMITFSRLRDKYGIAHLLKAIKTHKFYLD